MDGCFVLIIHMKLGKAFSDSVTAEKQSISAYHEQRRKQSWWLGMGRLLMFFTVLCHCVFYPSLASCLI